MVFPSAGVVLLPSGAGGPAACRGGGTGAGCCGSGVAGVSFSPFSGSRLAAQVRVVGPGLRPRLPALELRDPPGIPAHVQAVPDMREPAAHLLRPVGGIVAGGRRGAAADRLSFRTVPVGRLGRLPVLAGVLGGLLDRPGDGDGDDKALHHGCLPYRVLTKPAIFAGSDLRADASGASAGIPVTPATRSAPTPSATYAVRRDAPCFGCMSWISRAARTRNSAAGRATPSVHPVTVPVSCASHVTTRARARPRKPPMPIAATSARTVRVFAKIPSQWNSSQKIRHSPAAPAADRAIAATSRARTRRTPPGRRRTGPGTR